MSLDLEEIDNEQCKEIKIHKKSIKTHINVFYRDKFLFDI